MIAGVADTHTALWHLFGDARLSSAAEDFICGAAAQTRKNRRVRHRRGRAGLLPGKNRLPASAYDDLLQAVNNPAHVFTEAALTAEVVESMRHVPRSDVPDMPDRIVAATALYLRVPLISRDGRIRAANLDIIW